MSNQVSFFYFFLKFLRIKNKQAKQLYPNIYNVLWVSSHVYPILTDDSLVVQCECFKLMIHILTEVVLEPLPIDKDSRTCVLVQQSQSTMLSHPYYLKWTINVRPKFLWNNFNLELNKRTSSLGSTLHNIIFF